MVPVWCELLADLETPVAVYAKTRAATAPGSCSSPSSMASGGAVSFVGRRARATLEMRETGRAASTAPLPASMPLDRGILAALDALLEAAYRSPTFADLPPLQGGVMGYLGYDVVREVERLPDTPHDDRQFPDAVMC